MLASKASPSASPQLSGSPHSPKLTDLLLTLLPSKREPAHRLSEKFLSVDDVCLFVRLVTMINWLIGY